VCLEAVTSKLTALTAAAAAEILLFTQPHTPQAAQAAAAPIWHLRTLNPYLHSALKGSMVGGSLRVQAPRHSMPWASHASESLTSTAFEGRLVGGVSSFAFMGTNAHSLIAGPATIVQPRALASGTEAAWGGGGGRGGAVAAGQALAVRQ
jgi:hypothetical protein